MFWFKLCPRCFGDLSEDRDYYGKFITCMQCGYHQDVVETKIDANAGLKIKSAPAKRLNKEMEAA